VAGFYPRASSETDGVAQDRVRLKSEIGEISGGSYALTTGAMALRDESMRFPHGAWARTGIFAYLPPYSFGPGTSPNQ